MLHKHVKETSSERFLGTNYIRSVTLVFNIINHALRNGALCVTIIEKIDWSKFMDTASKIKELRASIGMNRKEFSEHTGIPIRTLEDWEAGRRTPPEYVPRLLGYMLKYEELIKK